MLTEFVGFSNVMLVGEGGLGRVYRATRDSTGGVVAVKELSDVAEGSAAWHRARRELEAMLLLKGHPYVVSVEEILDGPGGPLLVMEFLSGGSLAERVEAGPLTAAEVVLVGQHVSQALAAARRVGIVHRDVKPHNLLVGGFGQVKVCDFGISALARGDGRTQTKAMTLAYAAPEELDGDELVGPAADVYSLSATLLHLVTGRRPSFRDRISGSWSTPDGIDPALGPVMTVIRHGLSHDPDDRPTIEDYVGTFNAAARTLGDRSIQQLERSGAASPDEDVAEAGEEISDVAVAARAADDTVVRSDATPALDLLGHDVNDSTTRRRDVSASDGVISQAVAGPDETVGDVAASSDAADDVGDHRVAGPEKSRRTAWIVVGVLVIIVLLVGIGLFVTQATSGSYFVSFDESDQAIIYQGRPGGFLWIDPTAQNETGPSRDELAPAVAKVIDDEPTFDSADEAAELIRGGVVATIYDAGAGGGSGSVCVRSIVVADQGAAEDVLDEIKSGADFVELFQRDNLDQSLTSTNGVLPCISAADLEGNAGTPFVAVAATLSAGNRTGIARVLDDTGAEAAWVVLEFRPWAELGANEKDQVVAGTTAGD